MVRWITSLYLLYTYIHTYIRFFFFFFFCLVWCVESYAHDLTHAHFSLTHKVCMCMYVGMGYGRGGAHGKTAWWVPTVPSPQVVTISHTTSRWRTRSDPTPTSPPPPCIKLRVAMAALRSTTVLSSHFRTRSRMLTLSSSSVTGLIPIIRCVRACAHAASVKLLTLLFKVGQIQILLATVYDH